MTACAASMFGGKRGLNARHVGPACGLPAGAFGWPDAALLILGGFYSGTQIDGSVKGFSEEPHLLQHQE